jgi:predicted phosphodiesterase
MQMSMKKHDRILVISDLHFPYSHPEAIDFLSKLKSTYKPTYIVNIGDEVDMHSINVSHLVDPDLPSPHDELEIARSWIKRLEKLFPEMVILESNHGSMVMRRALASKMSRRFIKSYNDILDVNDKWIWKDKHSIDYKGKRILFAHQFSKDISKAVREYANCCVMGHFHTQADIKYVGNDYHLNWGMSVGCLINKDSLAMAYMKVNMSKPILSCGLITEGYPQITPMVLNKNGSWDKNIYI